MADVTISQLTQGTPNGNHLLPYSTGTVTLGVPVSAMFQNTSKVGIGTTDPLYNLHLVYNDEDQTNFFHGVTIRNTATPGIAHFSVNSISNNCGIRSYNSTHPTKPSYNEIGNWSSEGQLSFMVRSQSRMNIDGSGRVTKPFQPAFAVRANAQTLVQSDPNSTYPKISLTNEIFNIGNYWNSSLSQFVAPVAGVYSFSGMIRLNTFPGSYFYPTISINGTQYIDKYAVAGNGPLPGLVWTGGLTPTGSFVTTNWQQLIKLDAGDVIALNFRAVGNGTYQIDSQTVFYGYLLG